MARYFLPSAHEWYKAAYYDPTSGDYFNFPTGSDSAPTPVASGTAVYNHGHSPAPVDITLAGGLSPYGTMGQGGNVWEWEETDRDLVNDSSSSARGARGGSRIDASDALSSSRRSWGDFPAIEGGNVGFRVASIPEPSSLLLVAMAGLGLLLRRKR